MNGGKSTQYLLNFFQPRPYQLDMIEIDMDQTDLGLADIMRNINEILPVNSRDRNSIASGFKVLGVLCKSELLSPMKGLLLLVVGEETKISLVSQKYIIMGIRENKLTSDESIAEMLDDITMHMITSYQSDISKFSDFFIKFIFDDYEEEYYTY